LATSRSELTFTTALTFDIGCGTRLSALVRHVAWLVAITTGFSTTTSLAWLLAVSRTMTFLITVVASNGDAHPFFLVLLAMLHGVANFYCSK
jgi:hypothetical protein